MIRRSPDSCAAATTSRRSLLGGLAALLGTSTAGIAALAAAPEPAVAVDGDPAAFEVGDDPTVTSNDGRVESVYLSPELDVSWTDFGDGVDEVGLTLAVGSEEGVDPIYSATLAADDPSATPGDVSSVVAGGDGDGDAAGGDGDGKGEGDGEDDESPDFDAVDGALTVAFERVDATERGDAVTSETLSDEDLRGGETATTTLDVVYRADVVGGSDAASVVRTTTVDVSVTNPPGDATAGGEVDVNAS